MFPEQRVVVSGASNQSHPPGTVNELSLRRALLAVVPFEGVFMLSAGAAVGVVAPLAIVEIVC